MKLISLTRRGEESQAQVITCTQRRVKLNIHEHSDDAICQYTSVTALETRALEWVCFKSGSISPTESMIGLGVEVRRDGTRGS